jgi:hypothetical protein
MTRIGRYGWQTRHMELIELARTIQADRNRAIATETRRRQLMAATDSTPQVAPAARPVSSRQRPASSGALSR